MKALVNIAMENNFVSIDFEALDTKSIKAINRELKRVAEERRYIADNQIDWEEELK